jgi:hypothetical protein
MASNHALQRRVQRKQVNRRLSTEERKVSWRSGNLAHSARRFSQHNADNQPGEQAEQHVNDSHILSHRLLPLLFADMLNVQGCLSLRLL